MERNPKTETETADKIHRTAFECWRCIHILRITFLVTPKRQTNASWKAVYKKYHKSRYWKNTKGMKYQYYCHFYFAFAKESFNLEPGRPSVSWQKTIKALCNPT